ncbi:MAG: hypothetical protein H6R10_1311 [Rhodocyclaceae bacterium]|nr:hypothetical protein [Rhodocyclaceae bacterium]
MPLISSVTYGLRPKQPDSPDSTTAESSLGQALLTCPLNARSLLFEAKHQCAERGELVKLIMGGTRRVTSWVIENRILPVLRDRDARIFNFAASSQKTGRLSAWLVPLPEGDAFGCDTSGRWSALAKYEAMSAIQYIGFRYAPENRWTSGFEAALEVPGQAPRLLEPLEVASIWEEVTGAKPLGFVNGVLDEMEALGFKLVCRIFNAHGRLGL